MSLLLTHFVSELTWKRLFGNVIDKQKALSFKMCVLTSTSQQRLPIRRRLIVYDSGIIDGLAAEAQEHPTSMSSDDISLMC